MPQTFKPPLSGPVMGLLIDAFDLRRLDRGRILSKRNSRRYLSGERVSPDAEVEVHVAFAEAVVEAGLLPSGLGVAALLEVGSKERAAMLADVPVAGLLAVTVSQYVRHWDALAGACRRLTAPVAYPRLAAGACLRLVAIDLAVRLVSIIWLARVEDERPLLDCWCEPDGLSRWLRSLVRSASPEPTRDEIANELEVHVNTVDGWLDKGARPTEANLGVLAEMLAARGVSEIAPLLRRFRLAYGARALLDHATVVVGPEQAIATARRLVIYVNEMIAFPRASQRPEENDAKMRMALALGTLGRGQLALKWVTAMLNHLWRHEPDPVWRTSIKAVTSSWFEHLQDVTAKLGPPNEADFVAVFGVVPPASVLESIAYNTQSTKEEQARDPRVAAAMTMEAAEGGRFGALELKTQGCEAVARGDRLGAIELFRAATSQDPLNAEIHYRLGCCLWEIGDVPAGLAELEIAVQLEPAWDRARVEVAIVFLNEGRDEEALRRLLEGREALLSPSPCLLLHLAYSYERTNNAAEAINTYEELLAIEPTNAEALDRLAHLYFMADERRKGADRAKRAAHFGVPTVFNAWEAGYYDKARPVSRPAHVGLDEFLQFPDSAWSRRSRKA